MGMRIIPHNSGFEPVHPTTLEELLAYAEDDVPRVIEISQTFEREGDAIELNSDKTLRGTNNSATIVGGLVVSNVHNVIIQNLNIQGNGQGEEPPDGITIEGSHHVWVDHCAIWDAGDSRKIIERKRLTQIEDLAIGSWRFS